jgi:hypothetical protein
VATNNITGRLLLGGLDEALDLAIGEDPRL